MEAFAEDEVYSVPGHENGKKAGDRTDSQAIPATPTAKAAVEQNNIGKEGDEGPRLLGIPVPETTPRVVCPNSSQDNSRGKEQDSDLQAAIKVKDPRVIRRRQGMGSERADDEKVREAGRESEGTVAEGDGEDVDGEPEIAPQDGDKRIEGWVKDSGLEVGCNQSEDDDRRCS